MVGASTKRVPGPSASGNGDDRVAILIAAVGALIGLAAFVPIVDGYFASDDWLLLYYYGRVPVWDLSRHFSTDVIWFFRPFQALQFSALFHLFRFDPVPYNLALFLGHGVVCILLFELTRAVSRDCRLAAVSVWLFSFHWAWVDILLWKSNTNTLQWAAFSLLACLGLARDLRSPSRLWRWVTWLAAGAACLSKEMAVNMPFLFGAVWCGVRVPEVRREQIKEHLREAARTVAPAIGLSVAYGIFHLGVVRDVYDVVPKDYSLSPAAEWPAHLGKVFQHLFFPFGDIPAVQGIPGAGFALSLLQALPIVLCLVAVRTRSPLLVMGTLWICASVLPALLLRSFHVSRFYYVPAMGAAWVLSAAWESIRRIAATSGRERWLGAAGAAGLVLWCVANEVVRQSVVAAERDGSDTARAAFGALSAARASLPVEPLIVLTNAPPGFFASGIGIREMVRLALGNDGAEGVLQGQAVPEARLADLRSIPDVFVLNLADRPPSLRRVPAPPGARN